MKPLYTVVWYEKCHDGEVILLQRTFSTLDEAIKHAFDEVGETERFVLFRGASLMKAEWLEQWRALNEEQSKEYWAKRHAAERAEYERLKAKFEPTAAKAMGRE